MKFRHSLIGNSLFNGICHYHDDPTSTHYLLAFYYYATVYSIIMMKNYNTTTIDIIYCPVSRFFLSNILFSRHRIPQFESYINPLILQCDKRYSLTDYFYYFLTIIYFLINHLVNINIIKIKRQPVFLQLFFSCLYIKFDKTKQVEPRCALLFVLTALL